MASSRLAAAGALALALLATPAAGAGGGADGPAITSPTALAIQLWQPQTDDRVPVSGRVTLDGAPVSGVVLRVGDYQLPAPTARNGEFTYLADATSLAHEVVTVADDSQARSGGVALSGAERRSLAAQQAAINVAYALSDVRVRVGAHGDPTISGRIGFSDQRSAPPTVSLYTYQLTGTVTDASGKPVAGAVVSTRTGDRNYWTISGTTSAQGQYSSLFTASDESGDNPVPMNVEVAIGNVVYALPAFEFVDFPALHSARLDIQLPPAGYAMAPPLPHSYPGAVYQGIVVGASGPGGSMLKPVAATWPDRSGRFSLTLPRALAGHTVSLWEAELQLFSVAAATPGGPIQVSSWPSSLPADAPRDLLTARLP